MTDYIDREAAIGMAVSGRIRTLPTTEDGEDWIRVEEVRESLKRTPAADVRPVRWIPVTERLPENVRDVQITVFWHDAWRTMYGYYDGSFWHLYAPMHTEVADVEVIGWMEKPAPMPTPPKEEENEHLD